MYNRKHKGGMIGIALLVLVLSACGRSQTAAPSATSPAAVPSAPAAATIPVVDIELNGKDFKVPSEVPSGVVALSFKKNSDLGLGGLFIFKMPADKSLDELKALEKDFNAFTQAITALSGVDAPGKLIVTLAPGAYAVGIAGDDSGTLAPFTVKDSGNTASAPKADITAEIQDTSYALPDSIKTGKQIWQVTNKSRQLNHVLISKLADGKTIDDVIAWKKAINGPPPIVGGIGIELLSAGQTVWAEIDLPPGEYQVLSMMDAGNDPSKSLLEQGMHKVLKVTP